MASSRVTAVENIRTYLFGCRYMATFTLVSKKTGNRLTYCLRRVDGRNNFFYIDVLTGDDNETDYSFIGSVHRSTAGRCWVFAYSRKSKLLPEAPSVLGIDFFIALLNYSRDLDTNKIEFWHSGKCSRCGRILTVPSSLEIGMGPKCAEKARETLL